MKRILILTAILVFACSSDDSNSSVNNNTFNPPTWIQGVWLKSNVQFEAGFEFRQNDFCQVLSSAQTICIEQTYNQFPDFSVYEEISETRYFITYTISGAEYEYEFEKISDDLISWVAVDGSVYERQ